MPDKLLHERLFATNRYPSNRLNVYSKPDYLTFVHHTLRGTEEFETIRKSTFGKLYDIPAARASMSGKLVHAMLSRQPLTKNKYTLLTTFGGQPILFSLKKFGELTGLNCGDFPEHYQPDFLPPCSVPPDPWWISLIGQDPKTTLADIGDLLVNDHDMEPWRIIRLALLLIVDGVLIAANQTHKPTPKYVNMLQDLESFLAFPWGRESFLKTLACMRPGKQPLGKPIDMVQQYRLQLQQSTYALKGFPLPLQLLAFQSIPTLLAKLPNAADQTTFLELCGVRINQSINLKVSHILQAESSPNIGNHPEEGWGIWYDEYFDKKVDYMESLIRKGTVFTSDMWLGGDDEGISSCS